MQHIFLTQAEMTSPRWQQAFPSARMVENAADLPVNLAETLLWVLIADTQIPQNLSTWLTAGARIVVLTKNENPMQAKQVVEQGAHGYLHYLAATPVLQQVSQIVQLGGLWLGTDLMRQLVFATAATLNVAQPTTLLDVLTLREKSVAEAVAQGKTNKEVARELAITERTVKAHLSAVFEKLNVRDRLQLVLVLSGR